MSAFFISDFGGMYQNKTMSNVGSSSIIIKLQNQLFELKNDVAALEQNASPVYAKYFKSIEESQRKKEEKLVKWRENEIKAVNIEYESDKYSADCDEKRMKEENQKKNNDMIYFKADKLAHAFPEAYEYFKSQGYEFNFKEMKKNLTDTTTPMFSVCEISIPLIESSVIEEDMNTFNDNETEIPEALVKNGNINIQTGNLPSFNGNISNLQDNEVSLNVDGEVSPLMVNAVRFGETKCTKI